MRREHRLKDVLGLDSIRHFVISRFPVLGADPDIINYDRIYQLKTITEGMS